MRKREVFHLFESPADQEDDGLVSQRTTFPEFEFRLLLLRGKGMWLVVANFLASESFVLTAVYIGQAVMLL